MNWESSGIWALSIISLWFGTILTLQKHQESQWGREEALQQALLLPMQSG